MVLTSKPRRCRPLGEKDSPTDFILIFLMPTEQKQHRFGYNSGF
ncbi:hypothetical protein [Moraxella lacunata]